MKIEISLDTKDAADLAGLRALIAALDGGATVTQTIELDGTTSREQAQRLAEHIRNAPQIVEVVTSTGETVTAELVHGDETSALDFPPESDEPLTNLTPPDVDVRGIPWDERIHASTKATNGDDTWRNKRGVDKALLAAVEAELLAAVDSAPVPNAPDAPAATASGADVAEAASEVPLPPAPAAEASATIIPEAPASPSADAPTFKDAMAIVTTRQREGTLTQVQVSEAAQALGLSSVVDLAKPANAEHIAAFIALLG